MPNKADSGKSAMTANPFDWGRQWFDLSIKAQQAMTTLLEAQKRSGDLPTQLTQAASAAFGNMYLSLMRDPVALADAHVDLTRQHAKMWQDVFKPGGEGAQTVTSKPRDRRFRNEEWEKNLALRALMHSYMIGADWLRSLVDKGELDPADRKKVTFFTEQFIDASSPTNFAFTNPDVLKKTIETGGANLVQGFSNFLDDLLTNAGHVRRADNKAFELGVNIAATKGSVVFRNDMMELIQYEPTTETVRDVPLLLVPPWVNKYYLFDLQQKTSFIRWAIDQGFTVFAISWVNPDVTHADKDFENYWLEGPLAALQPIEKATGQPKVNFLGYCLGGTLTATGLAYLAARGDSRAASGTMIATMTDFSEFGDFEVFVNDESVKALRAELKQKGYVDQADLSRLFSLIRANDLIWSSAISSYLLAEDAAGPTSGSPRSSARSSTRSFTPAWTRAATPNCSAPGSRWMRCSPSSSRCATVTRTRLRRWPTRSRRPRTATRCCSPTVNTGTARTPSAPPPTTQSPPRAHS